MLLLLLFISLPSQSRDFWIHPHTEVILCRMMHKDDHFPSGITGKYGAQLKVTV